ncbi:hydroxyacid dehydrogenase [Thermosphaera aggregans]|uniref:Phosphoglycerate dehydrogenase n=1 Tax=Thermosphaera aggregans (strain DSM 11486 / M11TL) TaxID=633148 RepID=D5U2R5_THEAM|nr:hydroxyacid dehydrogenase [Thermosphaera aggregans]ADG91415.1 Phosphoglycerate dehydrogenase [Thermosphaera aggregans DSM 11486]
MKILVASRIHEKAIQLLKENGFEVTIVEEPHEDELARIIKGFDGLIVRSKPLVTKKVIESADRLKVIARAGVGLDNIDVKAAEQRGIALINAPESSTQSVAELAIGLMLAVARKIAFSDRRMREGYWAKKEAMGVELSGKTLGVIGAGRIGSAVARIAKYGFNMHILYYDVACRDDLNKELGAECVSIEELLKRSDIVTIHVPLLPETRHMINEEKLRLMKKTAILINTSRGAVVDTAALVKALSEGWIAGAGLDVFEEEPLPKDHPLTKLDNVVLTPHIGASTKEAQEKAGVEVARKIVEFFKK